MIDIEPLLAPISDAAPCGEDLSFAPELDAIQEFRRADDPSLDQGAWVTELKSADWHAVTRTCAALLTERSKDLRLAVWFAEAQTRLHGFSGVSAGYQLVAELCQRYWEQLHPSADEEDLELRIGNLAWLLNQSIQWARAIPLMESSHGRFNLSDIEMARQRSANDGDGSGPSLEQLDVARANTSFAYYQKLAEEAPAALAALNQLERVTDARLGQQGPSFSATRDALTAVIDTGLRYAREAGVSLSNEGPPPMPGTNQEETAAGTATSLVSTPAVTASVRPGEITTRKEALAQLRRVAEFFRRTEPHSPVAYLADKAARWGEMPLHVWLKSVVKDSGSLAQLEEMLDVGNDESHLDS